MNGARMPGQPCEKKEGGEKGPKKKKKKDRKKKKKLEPTLSLPYIKINLSWIQDLNVS